MSRPTSTLKALALLILCMPLLAGAVTAQEPPTIKPGMTEADVRAAWGEPLAVRKIDDRTYLYYRNDCLRTCGMHDIVFLEGGQVVNAIVRDKGRRYDGVSSSPAEKPPAPAGSARKAAHPASDGRTTARP